MKNDQISSLRSRLQALKKKSGVRVRVPKQLSVEVAREFLKSGLRRSEFSARLGIHPCTLDRWVKQTPRPSFKKISVVDDSIQKTPGISLKWPGGIVISGLSFNQLRILLGERGGPC